VLSGLSRLPIKTPAHGFGWGFCFLKPGEPADFPCRANALKLHRILQRQKGSSMSISASDIVAFTLARANFSELADQVKAGAEKHRQLSFDFSRLWPGAR